MTSPTQWMERAIALSMDAVHSGKGGPFGAVIVRDGTVIGSGHNQVVAAADPTAHAEVVAIRAACSGLATHRLDGCVLYSSCEPCPMCLSAIYWAHIERVYYANTREQASAIGFDDAIVYAELALPAAERRVALMRLELASAAAPLAAWHAQPHRVKY